MSGSVVAGGAVEFDDAVLEGVLDACCTDKDDDDEDMGGSGF